MGMALPVGTCVTGIYAGIASSKIAKGIKTSKSWIALLLKVGDAINRVPTLFRATALDAINRVPTLSCNQAMGYADKSASIISNTPISRAETRRPAKPGSIKYATLQGMGMLGGTVGYSTPPRNLDGAKAKGDP